jgi:3-hydroxymyristoyl/3-hydroxydecanoyl-(acyl carrier protein) dehydratase
MSEQLGFTGEPFDALAFTAVQPTTAPSTTAQPTTAQPTTAQPITVPPVAVARASARPAETVQAPAFPETALAVPVTSRAVTPPVLVAASPMTATARQLRLSVAQAHGQSLRALAALQRKALLDAGWSGRPVRIHNRFSGTDPADSHPSIPAETIDGIVDSRDASAVAQASPIPVTSEEQFKPLARTPVRDLDAEALARLARGDVAGVFGAAYDQEGNNASVRADGSLLFSVSGLSPRGGAWGRGRLTARTMPLAAVHPEAVHPEAAAGDDVARAVIAAVTQAAQVAALSFGLHLCLADATLAGECPGLPTAPARADVRPVSGPVELLIDITAVDLVPRPYLRADAEVRADGATIGYVRDVTVAVVERPGVPIGPEVGGLPSRWLGRRGATGERAILSEFHLAQCCRGDQGIGLGPEFARYTGRKATRPPDGGLLLVDRVMEINARRGVLDRGTHRTEYDSHADSWYYQDTANASMPNCVYMETSLQAALMLGYYAGATLAMPDETVSLRNLGGTATVLREVDLRDKTISEDAELLSTSLVPGSSLQSFAYTQSADGEPYYRGETLFGYFSDAAMANQTGLDAGRNLPTWLEAQQARPRTRTIDIAARRADPAARLAARRHLALLDEIGVVDGGGKFGLGYLWATRAIDPDDWFFARHFRYDPVVPGSLGVEAVLQAMQEWLLDTGHGGQLRDPRFVLPVGQPFGWKYRGQLLPTDREFTIEVHITSVQHRPGRVRAVAEASLWKPGLRIYHLTDAAVELREEGAPPW